MKTKIEVTKEANKPNFPPDIKSAMKWEIANTGGQDSVLCYPARSTNCLRGILIIGHGIAIFIDQESGLIHNSGEITGDNRIGNIGSTEYFITGPRFSKVTFTI